MHIPQDWVLANRIDHDREVVVSYRPDSLDPGEPRVVPGSAASRFTLTLDLAATPDVHIELSEPHSVDVETPGGHVFTLHFLVMEVSRDVGSRFYGVSGLTVVGRIQRVTSTAPVFNANSTYLGMPVELAKAPDPTMPYPFTRRRNLKV